LYFELNITLAIRVAFNGNSNLQTQWDGNFQANLKLLVRILLVHTYAANK